MMSQLFSRGQANGDSLATGSDQASALNSLTGVPSTNLVTDIMSTVASATVMNEAGLFSVVGGNSNGVVQNIGSALGSSWVLYIGIAIALFVLVKA